MFYRPWPNFSAPIHTCSPVTTGSFPFLIFIWFKLLYMFWISVIQFPVDCSVSLSCILNLCICCCMLWSFQHFHGPLHLLSLLWYWLAYLLLRIQVFIKEMHNTTRAILNSCLSWQWCAVTVNLYMRISSNENFHLLRRHQYNDSGDPVGCELGAMVTFFRWNVMCLSIQTEICLKKFS